MKRLYQLLAAIVVALLIPVATSAPTFAAATCDIGFTGPNSQNMCTSIETYQCTVNNENKVTITNSGNQTVASGSVTVSGNGTGGGSFSGSAGNNNNATFTVTIKNDAGGVGQGTCSTTVTVPATETPETVVPTKTTGPTTTIHALPVTGSDSTLETATIIAGIAAIIAGLSVGTVLAYRRIHTS